MNGQPAPARRFHGAARRRSPPTGPADLVLVNAQVLTMDPARPDAEAVAIAGDQILAIGTRAEVHRLPLSAIQYVDRIHVPVLLLAGTQDLHAPIDESLRLRDALVAAGNTDVHLEVLEGVATFSRRCTPATSTPRWSRGCWHG